MDKKTYLLGILILITNKEEQKYCTKQMTQFDDEYTNAVGDIKTYLSWTLTLLEKVFL